MGNFGAKPKAKEITFGIHVDKLPVEIVGRFLQKLSVGDSLKSETVSPRWKLALEKWGWTKQKKLNRDIVFEGASMEKIELFWENSTAPYGNANYLIHLFQYIGKNLIELDLFSFGQQNIEKFIPILADLLQLLPKLEKLNFNGFNLRDFVKFLPPTLRELTCNTRLFLYGVETLQLLSDRCPNLEEVPFPNLGERSLNILIELIGKFSRQKRLKLSHIWIPLEKHGALVPIGQLKELEELNLWDADGLDNVSLEAIIAGCLHLRALHLNTHQLKEQALFLLTKISKLTELQINDKSGKFTDKVLKAVAQRRQLKKLVVLCSEVLTDDGISFLIDKCKSLKSLFVKCGRFVTYKSLETVVSEVHRRNKGNSRVIAENIFEFGFSDVENNLEKVHRIVGNNPWIRVYINGVLWKFLISLEVDRCELITVRSFNAVIDEVHRRHGNPSKTLPINQMDKEIFFYQCCRQIKNVLDKIPKHPWLKINFI